jgi:hypothetical protein
MVLAFSGSSHMCTLTACTSAFKNNFEKKKKKLLKTKQKTNKKQK